MDESEELFATDCSLSRSTSISSLELSSPCASSYDSLEGHGKAPSLRRKRRAKREKTKLTSPGEKLRKSQKRYKSYLDQSDAENTFSELLKMVPLIRLVHGDRHWKYADAFSKLGRGYLEYKKFGIQALRHAEKAKSLILSCDPPNTEEKSSFIKCVVEIYLCLGKALLFQGEKFKEADNYLLKSWHVLKSLPKQVSAIHIPSDGGRSDADVLKKEIKIAMADVCIARKQPDNAVSSLQYVIDLSKGDSSGDERLIPIYSKLVAAEKSRKKSEINYEAVIEYALKAHEISTSCFSPDSAEVADTAFALGRAYASVDSEGTLNAAETYFNEALSVYANCSDSKALKVRDALSKVWMRIGKENDALKSLKEDLASKAEVFGECSAQVANTHKLIGGVYLSKGQLANAHKELEKCLRIETVLYGLQHWKTEAIKRMIGQVEQNPGFSKSRQSKLTDRPRFSSTIK